MKIGLTDVFSGLNNLFNIGDWYRCYKLFLLTDNEIKKYYKKDIKILSNKLKINENELLEKIKEYYGGYHFSDNGDELYNTESINNFFKVGEFISFLKNRDSIINLKNIIKNTSEKFIIKGDIMDQLINQILVLSYTNGTIHSVHDIRLCLILFKMGYITYVNHKDFKLRIVNKESFEALKSIL